MQAKSSLLNQLLGHDRAIVLPIPRHHARHREETANIRGLPVVFIDTAGLRDARATTSGGRIRRNREVAGEGRVLHVLDASEPLEADGDRKYLAEGEGGLVLS